MRISSEDLLYGATGKRLSISLPIPAIWEYMKRTGPSHRGLIYRLKDSLLFVPLLESLRPLFSLSWSVLHIDVRNSAIPKDKNWALATEIREGFFLALSRLDQDRAAVFERTNRLVLNYGCATNDARGKILDSLIEGFERDVVNE